jgi:hypothetical protein
MKEALNSPETSLVTRATHHNTPEDTFFIVTAVKTSNLSICKVVEQVHHIIFYKDSTENFGYVFSFFMFFGRKGMTASVV